MKRILSRILRDPDSLDDAAGAFGLVALVVVACWFGGAFNLWGQY